MTVLPGSPRTRRVRSPTASAVLFSPERCDTMRTQIHHLLAEASAVRQNAPAVTFKNVTVTYAQLWHDVEGFGATLRESRASAW